MTAEPVEDGEWVPAVVFADEPGSPLAGTVSVPLVSCLGADAALDVAVAAERMISWATAMKARAMARVAQAISEEPRERDPGQPARFGGAEAHAVAVSEIAAATAVSEGSAARALNEAIELCGAHWETLDALEDGTLSPVHARVVLDAARSLPAEHAPGFARLALQRLTTRTGRRRTPAELRGCLRRLRERLHPEPLPERKAAAVQDRGVWFAPEPDGMCTLTARLPAEAGLAIYIGLDRAARTARTADQAPDQTSDQALSLDQLRADLLTAHFFPEPLRPMELPRSAASAGSGGSAGSLGTTGSLGTAGSGAGLSPRGFRPEVVVTIPIGLALGADEDLRESAELEGYGPIDAATARRLAAIASNWFTLFTDPLTGEALGVGRTSYRVPAALRRYLAHRDGTCRFPGCTGAAETCEADHTVEWQHGGTTDPGNLVLLCRKHHALKSIGAWACTAHAPEPAEHDPLAPAGTLEWRSPLGRVYRTEPADRSKPIHPLRPQDPEAWGNTSPDPPPF